MSMTRRRVLAALAAAGGAGALTGGATSALLRDRREGTFGVETGMVDVVVDYWENPAGAPDPEHPDGTVDGTQLAIPLPGDDGRTVLRVSLPHGEAPNNPASLWLKAGCPAETTLAEILQVTVSYASANGTPTTQIVSGSLRTVANALREGRRLDGDPTTQTADCLTEEVYFTIESTLGSYVGSETASLPLSMVATQCRNTDPEANPFAAEEPCPPAYSCACDWVIGKVEVERRLYRGRTYPFDEGVAGYAIRVIDTDGDSGVAFELVRTDDDLPLLPLDSVAVKGGPREAIYPRQDSRFGFDTSALDTAVDGLIYAPENPNNGRRYSISYVLVRVCAPTVADGSCPDDAADSAASVGVTAGGRDRTNTREPLQQRRRK